MDSFSFGNLELLNSENSFREKYFGSPEDSKGENSLKSSSRLSETDSQIDGNDFIVYSFLHEDANKSEVTFNLFMLDSIRSQPEPVNDWLREIPLKALYEDGVLHFMVTK
jgi:hypothetical protein